MTWQTSSWEPRLVSWAHEGLRIQNSEKKSRFDLPGWGSTRSTEAFVYCKGITKQHSRTFYLASSLLPAEKRKAVRVLYAFCRITDDMVDRTPDLSGVRLDNWEQSLRAPWEECENDVAFAWNIVRSTYHIPGQYAQQLFEGVRQDLTRTRYLSFDDLVNYCYKVASTVGLMSMHIIGFEDIGAIPYAVKLGVALQLTNILRDVGEDWRNGRLYLPLEELHRFGLGEADIEAGRVDDCWRSFMRFQIDRVRRLYRDSLPGIHMLSKEGRFAISAAALLYEAILDQIQLIDYDVFRQRAYVSSWKKLLLLPSIWWQSIHGN